jgi:hypothetical protein
MPLPNTFKTLMLLPLMTMVACASPTTSADQGFVRIEDLLANPSNFDGKTITVKGWASIRHEDYGLWASRADYEARNWRRCISLLNTYNDPNKNLQLDRTEVTITGMIYKDVFHTQDGKPVIRLGACNPVGIRFADTDGLRRYP